MKQKKHANPFDLISAKKQKNKKAKRGENSPRFLYEKSPFKKKKSPYKKYKTRKKKHKISASEQIKKQTEKTKNFSLKKAKKAGQNRGEIW